MMFTSTMGKKDVTTKAVINRVRILFLSKLISRMAVPSPFIIRVINYKKMGKM
jgi:hypothetical protein